MFATLTAAFAICMEIHGLSPRYGLSTSVQRCVFPEGTCYIFQAVDPGRGGPAVVCFPKDEPQPEPTKVPRYEG